MSVNSSFTQSVTPSLNQIDNGLVDHLESTQYWAAMQTPSIGVSPSIAASAGDASRYLTYRERATGNKQPDLKPVQFEELGISPSVDSTLNPRLYPPATKATHDLAQTGLPRPGKSGQAKPGPSAKANANQDGEKWRELLNRSQAALGMRVAPEVSEESIQLVFERLLTRVENMNIEKNHTVPKSAAAPRGAVLKSVPKTVGSSTSEPEGDEKNAALQKKYAAVTEKNQKAALDAVDDSESLEETLLRQQLNELSRTQLNKIIVSCARLLPQIPRAAAEIPVLVKALVRNSPQVLQLQNIIQFAHEKLGLLYASVQDAPETRRYAAFCPKLQEEFVFLTEKQVAVIETILADYRELARFRQRIADLIGISLQIPQQQTGHVSLYDSIKQSNLLLERLQMTVEQAQTGSKPSAQNLAADELLDRSVENNLMLNPLGNEQVGRITDTLLWARGPDFQKYAETAIKQASAAAPKLLIRLTDAEAFEGFKVVCFVLNHFTRLFSTPSVNQMITKLSELRQYVDTSKALLASIRKHLGLAPNASANKMIEAVQALTDRALDDVAAASIVEDAARLLNVEPGRLVDRIREMLKAVSEPQVSDNAEEQKEDDSDGKE